MILADLSGSGYLNTGRPYHAPPGPLKLPHQEVAAELCQRRQGHAGLPADIDQHRVQVRADGDKLAIPKHLNGQRNTLIAWRQSVFSTKLFSVPKYH